MSQTTFTRDGISSKTNVGRGIRRLDEVTIPGKERFSFGGSCRETVKLKRAVEAVSCWRIGVVVQRRRILRGGSGEPSTNCGTVVPRPDFNSSGEARSVFYVGNVGLDGEIRDVAVNLELIRGDPTGCRNPQPCDGVVRLAAGGGRRECLCEVGVDIVGIATVSCLHPIANARKRGAGIGDGGIRTTETVPRGVHDFTTAVS